MFSDLDSSSPLIQVLEVPERQLAQLRLFEKTKIGALHFETAQGRCGTVLPAYATMAITYPYRP